MKEFLKFALKPHISKIIPLLIILIVQVCLQLEIIELFSKSLSYVKTRNIISILNTGSIMLILIILSIICMIIITYISTNISVKVAHNTREKIFHILTNLPAKEINRFKTSALMSRTARGVYTEQEFIIFILKDILIIPFVSIGVILSLSDNLLRITFILFIIISSIYLIYRLKINTGLYFKAKKTYGRINFLIREKIMTEKNIRTTGHKNYKKKQFKDALENSYKKNIDFQLDQYYLAPIFLLIFDLFIVILFGISDYINSYTPIDPFSYADLIILVIDIQLILYFISTLTFIPKLVDKWPKAYASSVRIEEVLVLEDKIKNTTKKPTKKSDFKGIEFKNVTFNTNGRDIISNVSFKIPSNTKTAIVGDISSGKTSLMYLLDKIYEITSGEILINGYDINDYPPSEIRKKISFAMQKTFILNDTILQNIILGDKNISKKEVLNACKKTGLDKLLENEKFTLDTILFEGGVKISTGFKKKLTLTRAIVHKREIYIFDEYNYRIENKTNIILTKNITEIKDIEHIIVLKDGKIVDTGCHKDLLDNCPEYKQLYNKYSKEEVI